MDGISQGQRQHPLYFPNRGPLKVLAKRDSGAPKLKATANAVCANEKSDELRIRRYDRIGAPLTCLDFKDTTVAKKHPIKTQKTQAPPEMMAMLPTL
ncbi:hypothetical protein N7504_008599 [Penicillium tannophilum]|nr:hypothetical protein N7504_008599 [Penicillium tannophilum]